MKREFLVFACLAVMLNCVFAGDETTSRKCICSEPQGFRGIKWGQSISEIPNLKSIGLLDFSKYRDVFEDLGRHPVFYYLKEWSGTGYVNEKDKLKIGYANVDEIIYLFREDRFYGAVIESLGSTERSELQNAVTAWMGSPTAEIRAGGSHIVIWEGCRVRVMLDYKRTVLASKRDIKLYIISKEMEACFIGF